MKFFKISIMFLVLMIFSVGFVFAEDANQTSDTLEVTDNDVISAGEVKNYADLSNEVNKKNADLTADYTFNQSTDVKRIDINGPSGSKYTINGNNHTIDGDGKAGLFRFNNVKVVINDLTIKNCGETAIIMLNGELTLNNVNFINNKDPTSGAAIYSIESVVNTNGCLFENNDAPEGSAIFAEKCNLHINSTTFTNKNPVKWSLIYSILSKVDIQNTLFENATSTYATALYATSSKVDIRKSKFSNLHANATAGAIAIKKLDAGDYSFVVQSCLFLNVSSAKNGGAIYADVNGNADNANEGVLINDTLFDQCSSEFGGAVLQLGGMLYISYSNFTNNKATYSGGAVYISNCTFYAANDTFENNTIINGDWYLTNGGALYLDYGSEEIEYCNFFNNTAYKGGAIYSFASYLEVKNSTFENNKEGIHGVLLSKGSFYKELFSQSDDIYVMDDEEFATFVDFTGKKIVLNPIAVTGSVNDTVFDLRKFGAVTPVEDQGNNGACWAFGTTGAFESAFLKATGIALDISNNNIQNSGIRYSIYGKPSLTEAGYLLSGLGYILSWLGVVNTENDTYDELGKISPIIFTKDSYHITDAVIIDTSNFTSMKDALIKYGALTVFVNGANPKSSYYNNVTHASYCDNKTLGNHFVTVVGWDDNYSRSNFKLDPGHDGAWICKNSWGTEWGDKGYFYLSYYDAPLNIEYAVGYVINNTEVYDRLYQYDVAAFELDYRYSKAGNDIVYANKYPTIDGDLIAAVGTYFQNPNQDYKITVLVNGKEVYTQSGKSKYFGFETVKLDKYVAVGKNSTFEVQIQTKSAPILENSREFFDKGVSTFKNGNEFIDLSSDGIVASIKVYTFKYENATLNPTQYYSPGNTVIRGYVEGAKVTISKAGKDIASTTVRDGKAVFNQNLTSGNYSVTVEYNDTEFVDTFEIYPSIIGLENYKVTYNSRYPILFALVDEEGNPLAKVEVFGFVDDKQVLFGVTDVNGFVVVFPGDFYLKLGTHTITAVNNLTGEEATSVVKVVSRFSSTKNIAMYYYDGTSFKVKVYNNAAYPIEKGVKVIFKIKNKSYARYTDKNGYVSFKIPYTVTPGTYKLRVSYAGESITKTVKVKQVIKAKKTASVKKSAKKLVYKVTLKGKKAIKGKKVTLKVNGKTFKAKTNKKGIAQFTIKKNVIKKLKAGKKYTMKITYLKNAIKTTLKVKR